MNSISYAYLTIIIHMEINGLINDCNNKDTDKNTAGGFLLQMKS